MAGPGLAGASLKGLCPRCGSATLFRGPAAFAACCGDCGLDFKAFNIGDGPAAFLILIVGAVIAASAILIDLAFTPPWWVHQVWLPVGILLTLGGLRIGKAALIFQEYKHQAGEGRVAR
jgi:uncharacterized protein (DUF983 family)